MDSIKQTANFDQWTLLNTFATFPCRLNNSQGVGRISNSLKEQYETLACEKCSRNNAFNSEMHQKVQHYQSKRNVYQVKSKSFTSKRQHLDLSLQTDRDSERCLSGISSENIQFEPDLKFGTSCVQNDQERESSQSTQSFQLYQSVVSSILVWLRTL